MPNERGKSKTRSSHNVIYEEIRKSLKSLGYHPLRPIFLDRWMRYRLIVVAVNHLATVLNREPIRVYQALLCRAERTVRGQPFMPNRQAQVDPKGLREEEKRGGLHVYCPHCGNDLLSAGKETRKEVIHSINSRRSPHNSPHLSVDLCNVNVFDADSVDPHGAGGTGGRDPDRGASQR